MKSAPRRHLVKRLVFFLLGLVLFYAPFALLVRILLLATGSHLLPDAHRLCLRMPFEWLSQPWMYPTMIGEPLYLVGLLVLPAISFILGPLFCGWLCPAGAVTEFLGRLVPGRFKIRMGGKFNPTPIRYGVLVGMLVSPYLGAYVCCTFCNFAMMQNLVSAAFGDPGGLSAWASFTIATFIVWFFVLGVFIQGGRGWCNLICPAGAAQGLAHALGEGGRFSRAVRKNKDSCAGCGACVGACPAWAISKGGGVNLHACNTCMDCVHICPTGSIRYAPPCRESIEKTNR